VADRPDFNIGTDGFHTSSILIDLSIDFFAQAGYSLGVDWPYRGTLVPMEHYQKNSNVQSIMLEINRNLYLEEPTNNKSSRYHEVKKVTQDYLDMLSAHLQGVRS
jgi:N-formylglutamate amidohydrolase